MYLVFNFFLPYFCVTLILIKMKKNLLFFTIFAFAANLSSQITLTRSHLVVPGKKVVQAYDQSNRLIATTGTNKTWDFTNLNADAIDSMRFGVAGWYTGHENFPKANMAFVYYDDDSFITFLDITDNEVITYGTVELTDTGNIVEDFELKLVTFPSTYNTSYNSSVKFPGISFPLGFDPDSSGPIPFIDSIQVSLIYATKSTMDGWGTVKTPLGDYQALMQTTQNLTAPSVKMFSSGVGIDVPQSLIDLLQLPIPTGDTSYTVNFWTNDATVGFPLISYDYQHGISMTQEVTWLMQKPGSSSIDPLESQRNLAYPNPVLDYLSVKSPVANASIAIYDMMGQLVFEQALEGQSPVSVQHLNKGLYVMQLTDSSNGQLISTQKIIKQ